MPSRDEADLDLNGCGRASALMVNRYYQTLGRIGFGLATMAALTWLLWPSNGWSLDAEPLNAFVLAFVVWLFTEFKMSEEVIYRASTPNDIRLGREVFSYSTWVFRELLKDHDYHRGIRPRYFSEATGLLHESELGIAHFQDRKVQRKYDDFITRLRLLIDHMTQFSTPERFGSVTLQSIIPARIFDDMNISEQHRTEIREANRLATEAWKAMVPLIAEIKIRIPEVFDEPIKGGWIRSLEEQTR